MPKAKNLSVQLTDEQQVSLLRNAEETGTTTDELLHEIVAEWLARHGTGYDRPRPGGPRHWPEGEVEKAEKREADEKADAEAKELAEAQKAEAERVKAAR